MGKKSKIAGKVDNGLKERLKSNARRGKKTYVAFLDVRKAYPTCRRAATLTPRP